MGKLLLKLGLSEIIFLYSCLYNVMFSMCGQDATRLQIRNLKTNDQIWGSHFANRLEIFAVLFIYSLFIQFLGGHSNDIVCTCRKTHANKALSVFILSDTCNRYVNCVQRGLIKTPARLYWKSFSIWPSRFQVSRFERRKVLLLLSSALKTLP